MAELVLSSVHFREGVDALYEHHDDYDLVTSSSDVENRNLEYSIGYNLPVDLHPSLHPVTNILETVQDENTEERTLKTDYVEADGIVLAKLSLLSCCHRDHRTYYKNVYMLSTVFLLVIGSHYGLVGIQSSINSDVGLVTLAVLNATFVVSIVIAPAVIWLLGIRSAMLTACIAQFVYILSNYLLNYYTLIPGAVIGGSSLGIIWITANLYISITASNLAKTINIKTTTVIGNFGGIFYMFIAISLMIGNCISSAFLIARDEGACTYSNLTALVNISSSACLCETDSGFQDTTRFFLVSIYGIGDLLAIVVLLIGVGNLPRLVTDSDELRARIVRYLKHSVLSIVQVNLSTKASWLIPLFVLEGLEASYYLGAFTTDFVAQCVGLKYVGFAVAVWAFGSAISSFISGRLVKYVKRFTLFIFSIGMTIFLSLFLIFFNPKRNWYFIFFVSFAYGVSDGTIKTATSCLISGRFPKVKTAAYSALRLWVGVGLTIHFVLNIILPHDILLWIILGIAIISMPLYGLVDRNARCTIV